MTDEVERAAEAAFQIWDNSGDHEPNGFARGAFVDGYLACAAEPPQPEAMEREIKWQRIATMKAVFSSIQSAMSLGETAESAVSIAALTYGVEPPQPASAAHVCVICGRHSGVHPTLCFDHDPEFGARSDKPASVGGVEASAWELGYASGYDDREKMDHDRADVIKTENPFGTPAEPLPPSNEPASSYLLAQLKAYRFEVTAAGETYWRGAFDELERRWAVKT